MAENRIEKDVDRRLNSLESEGKENRKNTLTIMRSLAKIEEMVAQALKLEDRVEKVEDKLDEKADKECVKENSDEIEKLKRNQNRMFGGLAVLMIVLEFLLPILLEAIQK